MDNGGRPWQCLAQMANSTHVRKRMHSGKPGNVSLAVAQTHFNHRGLWAGPHLTVITSSKQHESKGKSFSKIAQRS